VLGLGLSFAKQAAKIVNYVKDSLKAYYRFSDNAPDFLLDGSASLSGSSQYIDCGTGLGDALGDNYAGDLTVSMWFKADVTSGDDGMFEIGSFTNSSTGTFVLRMKSNTLTWITKWDRRIDVSFTDTSSWHHVVGVYDSRGADFTKLYLDGVSVGSAVGTFPSASDIDLNGLKTTIGGYYGTPYTFDGKIANVGIWNRALSVSEIESIQWRGSYSELKDTELTNLVSWYDLSSIGVSPTELISNGTMETASSLGGYSSFPEDWTESAGSPSIHERSSTQAFAGTYSLRYGSSGDSWNAVNQNSTVTGGVAYRLEFYIYGVTGSTMKFSHFDGSGNASTLENGDSLVQYAGSVTIGEWKKFTYDLTTYGSGVISGYGLQIGSDVSGTEFYIDNVSLKRINGAPDSQGSNDGTIEGVTINTDSYSGESPFKPRIQDLANPKMAVQLADGSTLFAGSGVNVDDYIDLDAHIGDFSSQSTGTISLWFKTASSGYQALISASDKGDGSSNYTILMNAGDITLNIRDNAVYAIDATNTTNYNDNEWHHLAWTVDGSGNKLYIDGSQITLTYSAGSASTQAYFSSITDLDALTIGGNKDTHGSLRVESKFNGSMANVALYSSALTQTQVQELMFTEKYSGLSSALKTNLVSFYDMGSSSNPHNDLHGSNNGTNNGTTVNTGYTYSPHGVVDSLNYGELYSMRALSFDGVNDALSIDSLTLSGSQATFSLWAKFDFIQANRYIFDTANSSNANRLIIGFRDDSGTVKLAYMDQGGTGWKYFGSVIANKWYHIAIVFNGTTLSGYVDGVQYGSDQTITAIDLSSQTQSSIGANYVPDGSFLGGDISNVKVFSTNLSEANIQQLYNNPETVLPTGVSASNLKLDLPMQEGSGLYVYDGSGNQNHGTIAGATWVTGEEYGYQSSLVRSNTPMLFDGSDDVVTIADNATTQDIFATGGTVQAIFKLDGTAQDQLLFSKSANSIYINMDGANNIALRTQHATTNGKWTAPFTNNTEFTHLVITHDKSSVSNNPSIYVNGSALSVTETSTPVGASASDSGSNLIIGSAPFVGIANEITIWDKVLDADAVTALYNSGVPLLPTSDSGNYDNSDDLQGYWRNDGNTTWTDRANTGVASFDGVDDKIAINGFTMSGNQATFSFWAKLDTVASGEYLLDTANSSGAQRFIVGFKDDSGTIKLSAYRSEAPNAGWKYFGAVTTGVWHNVVIVLNDTTATAYVDGVQLGSNQTITAISLGSSSQSHVGATYGGSGNHIDGIISEVAIWNTNIDSDGITALYGSGTPLLPTSDSGNYDNSSALQIYLRNDGNTTWTDRSTNSNNGTASGSPVSIVIPEGNTSGRDNQGFLLSETHQNSLRLHGSEYVSIQDSEVLSFGDGNDDRPFSIEAWVKMDDATNFAIISKGIYNTSGEWKVAIGSDDKIYFMLMDESVADTFEYAYTSAVTSYENEWLHVCCVYDGRGGTSANAGQKIYLNGSQVSVSLNGAGTYVAMENLSANVHIGRDDANYAKGLIDEVRIYSKELSASEILKNYNSSKSSHS